MLSCTISEDERSTASAQSEPAPLSHCSPSEDCSLSFSGKDEVSRYTGSSSDCARPKELHHVLLHLAIRPLQAHRVDASRPAPNGASRFWRRPYGVRSPLNFDAARCLRLQTLFKPKHCALHSKPEALNPEQPEALSHPKAKFSKHLSLTCEAGRRIQYASG